LPNFVQFRVKVFKTVMVSILASSQNLNCSRNAKSLTVHYQSNTLKSTFRGLMTPILNTQT